MSELFVANKLRLFENYIAAQTDKEQNDQLFGQFKPIFSINRISKLLGDATKLLGRIYPSVIGSSAPLLIEPQPLEKPISRQTNDRKM